MRLLSKIFLITCFGLFGTVEKAHSIISDNKEINYDKTMTAINNVISKISPELKSLGLQTIDPLQNKTKTKQEEQIKKIQEAAKKLTEENELTENESKNITTITNFLSKIINVITQKNPIETLKNIELLDSSIALLIHGNVLEIIINKITAKIDEVNTFLSAKAFQENWDLKMENLLTSAQEELLREKFNANQIKKIEDLVKNKVFTGTQSFQAALDIINSLPKNEELLNLYTTSLKVGLQSELSDPSFKTVSDVLSPLRGIFESNSTKTTQDIQRFLKLTNDRETLTLKILENQKTINNIPDNENMAQSVQEYLEGLKNISGEFSKLSLNGTELQNSGIHAKNITALNDLIQKISVIKENFQVNQANEEKELQEKKEQDRKNKKEEKKEKDKIEEKKIDDEVEIAKQKKLQKLNKDQNKISEKKEENTQPKEKKDADIKKENKKTTDQINKILTNTEDLIKQLAALIKNYQDEGNDLIASSTPLGEIVKLFPVYKKAVLGVVRKSAINSGPFENFLFTLYQLNPIEYQLNPIEYQLNLMQPQLILQKSQTIEISEFDPMSELGKSITKIKETKGTEGLMNYLFSKLKNLQKTAEVKEDTQTVNSLQLLNKALQTDNKTLQETIKTLEEKLKTTQVDMKTLRDKTDKKITDLENEKLNQYQNLKLFQAPIGPLKDPKESSSDTLKDKINLLNQKDTLTEEEKQLLEKLKKQHENLKAEEANLMKEIQQLEEKKIN